MDKYIRNQIIEILSTVKEGIQHINSVSTQGVLIDDCTMALKSIDEACKNGLSKERYGYYQQILDGVSKSLMDTKELGASAKDLEELCTLSCQLLEFISKSLMQEAEVKKEILFLPYKASMWDSLESIWLAAKEDSNCDAYVMPIPYYDLGPNKEAVKLHYEGERFPDYVPITDYKKYDIAKRKPDVIYIHNPYDGYNRVTSVDPAYYSSELKKYTNMLVYVPYFVSGENIEEHFCQIPGILYADRVIVQSKVIKEQYERYYPGGNPPKDKFLALGSPKIDKVLNSKREDFVLPDEWKRIIDNKKVVLYNTHLDGIMNHPDKILNKLRYVFSVFKDRKDVVLWWRPHPLGEATAQAMQPAILEEYRAVEKAYRESGIGIFDDTSDLHRALAVSDAYFGDRSSSLVWLYGVTGKPMMFQDFGISHENRPLFFANGELDDDELWFIDGTYHCLFKLNLNNGNIEYIAAIPGENAESVFSYDYILIYKIKNKIIIFPYEAGLVWEYDIENGEFEKKLSLMIDENTKCNFGKCIKHGDYVFFIGASYPAIIRYNTETEEYIWLTEWFDKVKAYIVNSEDDLICNACVRKNSLLLTFHQRNIIIEMEMDTGKSQLHFVGDKENTYQAIAFDGKNYWLIQRKLGSIVRWNYETGETKEYDQYLKEFHIDSTLLPFASIVYWKDELLVFPALSNIILKIDTATEKISKLKDEKGICIMSQKISENKLFVLAIYKEESILFVADNKYEQAEGYLLELPNELFKKVKKIQKKSLKISNGVGLPIVNETTATMKFFLDYLCEIQNQICDRQKQKNMQLIQNSDGTSGINIHQYIGTLGG